MLFMLIKKENILFLVNNIIETLFSKVISTLR
jgi:hypothetical protein